jgi:hypothetical protein
LRVFAGPFESESTAIAWIIQRQETMNLRRPERALIGRYALVGSFAQRGSKPHFSGSRWRPPVTE